jgi:hypothetical protein
MEKNPNQPNREPMDTEFAEETNPQRNLTPNETVNNHPERKEAEEREEKKANNPRGANQYTSGRVDDRGRKE